MAICAAPVSLMDSWTFEPTEGRQIPCSPQQSIAAIDRQYPDDMFSCRNAIALLTMTAATTGYCQSPAAATLGFSVDHATAAFGAPVDLCTRELRYTIDDPDAARIRYHQDQRPAVEADIR